MANGNGDRAMTFGARHWDRLPPHDGQRGQRIENATLRSLKEAEGRWVGVDQLRQSGLSLVPQLKEVALALPPSLGGLTDYLDTLIRGILIADQSSNFRDLALHGPDVALVRDSVLTLSKFSPREQRLVYWMLASVLATLLTFLSACSTAPAQPPAITVEVDPTATPEPATVAPEPSPEVTVTATPIMPQDEEGNYTFEDVGSEKIPKDKQVDCQLQVNAFAEKVKKLGIDPNIKLMVVWLGDKAIIVGEFGGVPEDYIIDDEGNVADYGPGDYVYESSQPPGYGFATAQGAGSILATDIDRVELNASSGTIKALGPDGAVKGSVSLGVDDPQWKPVNQDPTPVEPATATTAPATSVSPATETPPPAPAEASTAVPTTVEQVDSPEHAQAMENVRRWLSDEMRVKDEWRFRRLNGRLLSYGRVDEEVQDDRTMNPTESYSGVVLGWAKLPNGDVITYLGFEDNGGTRFVAPFRIGNNATTFGNIALVDSLENSTAGNNSDTVVFLKPESFGEKFEESIGRQVVISILFSFSQYSSDQLEQVPEFSLREFSDQFDLAKIFDSAMIKIMRGAEFEELSPQEKSIFIQYTNSGNGLLRITQAVI